jgi:hypothetical protein
MEFSDHVLRILMMWVWFAKHMRFVKVEKKEMCIVDSSRRWIITLNFSQNKS